MLYTHWLDKSTNNEIQFKSGLMQIKCWCYLLLSYILNDKFTVTRHVLSLAKIS